MDRKRGSGSGSPQPKRQKVSHDPGHHSPSAADAKTAGAKLCAENLATGLLNEENVERLRQEYAESEPFKYAKVETLFQDDLLRKVKDECMTHLSFTEKETDIYRVSAPVTIPRTLSAFTSFPLTGVDILLFSRVDPSPCFAFTVRIGQPNRGPCFPQLPYQRTGRSPPKPPRPS